MMIHLRRLQRATYLGALLTGCLVVTAPRPATAASCDTWTGAVSNSWDVAGNWSAGVPTSAVAACIPSGQRNSVSATSAAHAASLRIGAGAQVSVQSSSSLILAGMAEVSGELVLFSNTASLEASRVNVLDSGTLIGTGRIIGDVRNDGSVQVLDGGNGIPLRVSGCYHQNPDGSLLLRDEAGEFTELRARHVSLAGTLDLLILDALRPGARYTIVNAETIAGHFSRPAGYRVRYGQHSVAVVVTPEIHITPPRVAPGQRIDVAGASFGYLGHVVIHLDGPNGPVIGSGSVTSIGFFDTKALIPSATKPGAHAVFAINTAYGYRAHDEIRVA